MGKGAEGILEAEGMLEEEEDDEDEDDEECNNRDEEGVAEAMITSSS